MSRPAGTPCGSWLLHYRGERKPAMTEKPQNWQQVRAKIERGESGDKIGGFDPAAAPLGTDDEAAGCPTLPVAEDSNPGGAQVRRDQFRRE